MKKLDLEYMDKLVDRFWLGQASESEEEALKALAKDAVFKDKFPETAFYFDGLTTSANSDIAKSILLKTSQTKKLGNFKSTFLRVAASIIVAIGLGIMFTLSQQEEYSQEEIEHAYKQTQAAFMLISTKMDHGMNHASGITQFEKQQQEIINSKFYKKQQ